MASFPIDIHPYPAYKPSGVEWLGDVPEHWDVRRDKALLCPVDIRSKTGNEELPDGALQGLHRGCGLPRVA